MQAAGIQLHDHLLALLHHWLLLAFSAEAFPKPFHFVKNSLKNFNSVKLYSTGMSLGKHTHKNLRSIQ